MRELCRDCIHFCIYCQMCHEDKEVHEFNDSCILFEPDEPEQESEASE